MSDSTDIPAPPDDVKAFLAQHEATGEPSDDAVARVRSRVVARRPTAHTTTMLPRPVRRFRLTHEWLAVAAVLVMLLGARAAFVAFRSDDASTVTRGPQVQAVVDAYRAGDLEGAQRLASQHCTEGACASLAASLAKAIGLSKRLDTLSASELDELARLDAELAAGQVSPLAAEVAKRRSNPPALVSTASGEALLEQAQAHLKAKEFEQAIRVLKACVRAHPEFHPCYRVLGSAWARVGIRDGDDQALEEARVAYEDFVRVAPPDDPYVPKVKLILQQATGRKSSRGPGTEEPLPEAGRVDAEQLLAPPAEPTSSEPGPGEKDLVMELNRRLESARAARTRENWRTVVRDARRVLEIAPRNIEAQSMLGEARNRSRDVYLQGYQLKDSDPAEARRLFQQVVDMTPDDDEYHQKAAARVSEMRQR